MTDRELLELAAKAAGYEISYIGPSDDVHIRLRKGVCREFNPLTDDGDALRLAVKLNLSVFIWDEYVNVTQAMTPFTELEIVEDEFAEKNAATRRAIVRAAAELGKGMK